MCNSFKCRGVKVRGGIILPKGYRFPVIPEVVTKNSTLHGEIRMGVERWDRVRRTGGYIELYFTNREMQCNLLY